MKCIDIPVTWGSVVVFDGYSGFLHYFQLAAILRKEVLENQNQMVPLENLDF